MKAMRVVWSRVQAMATAPLLPMMCAKPVASLVVMRSLMRLTERHPITTHTHTAQVCTPRARFRDRRAHTQPPHVRVLSDYSLRNVGAGKHEHVNVPEGCKLHEGVPHTQPGDTCDPVPAKHPALVVTASSNHNYTAHSPLRTITTHPPRVVGVRLAVHGLEALVGVVVRGVLMFTLACVGDVASMEFELALKNERVGIDACTFCLAAEACVRWVRRSRLSLTSTATLLARCSLSALVHFLHWLHSWREMA